MNPCQRIHLTPRGELVSEVLAGLVAFLVIPTTFAATVWMLIP